MIDLLQMQHALAHDPCRRSDRSPFGAVEVGERVSLLLRVERCARPDVERVYLEFCNDPPKGDDASDNNGIIWRQIPMRECDEGYRAEIDTHGCMRVIFYRFRVVTALSDVLYIKSADYLSTAGASYLPNFWIEDMDPSAAFQLTVYEPGFKTPEWMHGATMYQIFPDRFSRGRFGIRECGVESHRKRGWPVKVHEDWNEPPDWREPYEPIDFFGGTLEGIAERLDYLADLGVDVIYLNPVCESRSNHRYNTGDYAVIDPILGDWDDFSGLCDKAGARGIRVILDTVLSHTGASSLYFNIDGSYDSVGAFQGEDSPYRSWYDFTPGEFAPYRCWWNDPTLPEVDECDASWQEYMLSGTSSRPALSMWQERGCAGFRLDVADEIPDDVLCVVRSAIKAQDADACIIGEVWEDPTTKMSYGARRTYALGRSLDSVMNYPLRSALISFALGERSAAQVSTFLRMQKSNYPRPLYEALMNLLSSHDVERIRSVLSLGREFRDIPREEQVEIVGSIDSTADHRASVLQRMLAMITYMIPGMPCIYYGDERGMHGGRDPFCRASFPWDGQRGDCGEDLTDYYRALGQFRSNSPALRKGSATFSYYRQNVLCIVRIHVDGDSFEGMLCVANRSPERLRVAVDLADEATGLEPEDIIALRLLATRFPRLVFSTDADNMSLDSHATLEDGIFIGEIGGLQANIYQISPGLGKPLERGGGIVCHITSLPADDDEVGCATLGGPAFAFLDALHEAGIKYWQMLPINPVDEYGSPYAGLSAFAGNANLIDGPLGEEETGLARRHPGYREFVESQGRWLDMHATYHALRHRFGDRPWWEWPNRYRKWDPSLLESEELEDGIERERAIQFIFDMQMRRLREQAASLGVKIIGDMPFYVSCDSPDVWAHPEYFSIDSNGGILEEGGVPPDDFSETGQCWGVPAYRWDVLERAGYDWWIERLDRMFDLFDYVRIDHFLGFSAYYAIAGEAREGKWIKGPGLDLFKRAHDRLGPLPVIAEDLGIITPEVRQLLAQTDIPGMDVVQFFDGDVLESWQPASGRIVYTSTHDTPTLVGWAADRLGADAPESEEKAVDIARRISYKILDSRAEVVMFSLQDVIRLGNEARMNVPGTIGDNWKWRADKKQIEGIKPFLRRIASRRR